MHQSGVPSPAASANRWEAIVIGSGLGGLSTAAYLAANGLRTLVLEQYDVAGGSSQTFRRKRQWQFDVGLHYIGDCRTGPIATMLKGIGVHDRIEFLEMDPDGFDTLHFPGLEFRVPKGWDRYEQRLHALFPAHRHGIERCMRIMRDVGEEVRGVELPRAKLDYLRFPLKMTNTIRHGIRPLTSLFDACKLPVQARAIIVGQAANYAVPPSRTPVALHAGLLDHYVNDGAYYPRGGGQVIAAHLIDVITAHAGRVRTHARVKRIVVERGRVQGVMLESGERLYAPVVVSAADLKQTFLGMLDPSVTGRRRRRRVERYRMAAPLFCAYLGVDIDLRERLPNSQHWCYGDFDPDAIYARAHAGEFDTDPFLYMTSATVKDPTGNHAPEGCSALELMTIVPPAGTAWGDQGASGSAGRYSRNANYRAIKEGLIDKLIDRAEQLIPDLRAHILWRESATPLTHQRYTLSNSGTSYGIEFATDQAGVLRPNPTTRIDGLYLAGASTRSGHGIMGTLTSGIDAASAVLNRSLLREAGEGTVFADTSRLTAGGPGWDALAACRRLQDKSARIPRGAPSSQQTPLPAASP